MDEELVVSVGVGPAEELVDCVGLGLSDVIDVVEGDGDVKMEAPPVDAGVAAADPEDDTVARFCDGVGSTFVVETPLEAVMTGGWALGLVVTFISPGVVPA